MKRAYFVTVIEGVFCVVPACDKQAQNAFDDTGNDRCLAAA